MQVAVSVITVSVITFKCVYTIQCHTVTLKVQIQYNRKTRKGGIINRQYAYRLEEYFPKTGVEGVVDRGPMSRDEICTFQNCLEMTKKVS